MPALAGVWAGLTCAVSHSCWLLWVLSAPASLSVQSGSPSSLTSLWVCSPSSEMRMLFPLGVVCCGSCWMRVLLFSLSSPVVCCLSRLSPLLRCTKLGLAAGWVCSVPCCVPGETAQNLPVFIQTGRIIQSRGICLAQHFCLIRMQMSVFWLCWVLSPQRSSGKEGAADGLAHSGLASGQVIPAL